jgi:hypothetical protein
MSFGNTSEIKCVVENEYYYQTMIFPYGLILGALLQMELQGLSQHAHLLIQIFQLVQSIPHL